MNLKHINYIREGIGNLQSHVEDSHAPGDTAIERANFLNS